MSQQYEPEVELGSQVKVAAKPTQLQGENSKRAQENACHPIISEPKVPEWSLLDYQMDSLKWRKTPIYLAHSQKMSEDLVILPHPSAEASQ